MEFTYGECVQWTQISFNRNKYLSTKNFCINKNATCVFIFFSNRPLAGHGWWLCYLLFGAYFVNYWKFEKSINFEYKFSTVITFGMVLLTETVHISPIFKNRMLRYALFSIPSIVVSLTLIFVLHQGILKNYCYIHI